MKTEAQKFAANQEQGHDEGSESPSGSMLIAEYRPQRSVGSDDDNEAVPGTSMGVRLVSVRIEDLRGLIGTDNCSCPKDADFEAPAGPAELALSMLSAAARELMVLCEAVNCDGVTSNDLGMTLYRLSGRCEAAASITSSLLRKGDGARAQETGGAL